MQNDFIDELVTQHAIFKCMLNDIIPCGCGGRRKIIQTEESGLLITHCPVCNDSEPFNIADLAIIGGALLKLVFNEGGDISFNAPNVSSDQICRMIEDVQAVEDWADEIDIEPLRNRLKILKGGLSK